MTNRIYPDLAAPASPAALATHDAWQTVSDNLEPGYAGHGPKFAAKCNEIGAVLGLQPVGVKGRGGLPDCAQWPLNVRPEGYYGEAPRAQKAVKRACKSRASSTPRARKPTALERALAALAELTTEDANLLRHAVEVRLGNQAPKAAPDSDALGRGRYWLTDSDYAKEGSGD